MDKQLKRVLEIYRPPTLARLLSEWNPEKPISKQGVYTWTRIPAERVLGVEAVTGISRHELRPDIYPDDRAA